MNNKYYMKNMKNWKNFNENINNLGIIDEIKNLLGEDILTMGEMEVDASPVYTEEDGEFDPEIHLIERLYDDRVDVVVYGGYKYNTELNEYQVKYEDLEDSTLEEIKEILENYRKDEE